MYNGPKYHTIKAIDEFRFEVIDNQGRRVGVYSDCDMAQRVVRECDKAALREYVKAQRKAGK